MKPIYGKVRGSKAIRAGMGLEEIEIDFSKLPNGLIAVCGKNGTGKTTILDLLCHPFRLQPYKLRESKAWSPDAFSYYNEFYGRDGYLERVFEMNGARYRSIIMIDAEKRKQECYLYREEAGTWIPYNAAVKAGKTRAYDEAVEELVGSPSLFFSSVFRSQDARKLSSYPRSEILGIVTELLNIDHIRIQGDKANEVVKALARMVEELEAKKQPLLAAMSKLDELQERKAFLGKEIAHQNNGLEVFKRTLTDKEQSAHDLELAFAAEAVSRKRLDDMKAEHARLQAEITAFEQETATRLQEYDAEIARLGEALAAEKKQLTADIETMQTDLEKARQEALNEGAAIEQKRNALKDILARADEINAAVTLEKEEEAGLAHWKEKLEAIRVQYAGLQKEAQTATQLTADIKVAQGDLENIRHRQAQRIANLKREQERDRQQVASLGNLDCKADGSGWINETCPLLVDAMAARQRLDTLSQEIEEAARVSPQEETLTAQIAEMKAKRTEMGDVSARLEACGTDGKEKARLVAELEKKLTETRKVAQLVFELDTAKTRMEELEQQEQAVLQRHSDKCLDVERQVTARMERSRVAQEDIKTRTADVQAKRDEYARAAGGKDADLRGRAFGLQGEIEQLSTSLDGGLEANLKQIQIEIATAKQEVERQETTLRNLYGQIGGVEQQLAALKESQQVVEAIDGKIVRINAEAINWRILAKACSNDGIIQLELDDSGPAISALTNDLLLSVYGPRFSIRLETQALKADGGLKEVFDVTIFDAERDEEKSIRDMSGGEVTYIEDAITRAFCLFNLNRSNRVYESLFCDEKDGALDQDRKTEFLTIKRRALEIGSHRQEYFITQTPDLFERADARIVLEKGGVTIQ